jgi:hypothetical protein
MRPVHRLLEKLKAHKARKATKAAQALNAHRIGKEDTVRQALIYKLCGELGRPPIKLMRR